MINLLPKGTEERRHLERRFWSKVERGAIVQARARKTWTHVA